MSADLTQTTAAIRRAIAARARERVEQAELERIRIVVAKASRAFSNVERLEAEHRRLRAEPIVEEAIADGRLPADAREATLRLLEVNPAFVRSDLERREPDPQQAARNRVIADPARDLAEREQIARAYGIPLEDVV